MKIYFTSDTHFNHVNIVRYCNRPFPSYVEMNKVLIDRWNAKVKPEDMVYHLGDFAMGLKSHWPEFLEKLNGDKILILGSHDSSLEYQRRNMKWRDVQSEMRIRIEGYGFWRLMHRPLLSSDDQILSGHVHNEWRHLRNHINVGVDVNDFEPKTIEELLRVPTEN